MDTSGSNARRTPDARGRRYGQLEPESITIRPVREGDVPAVELLAELEGRPIPPGPLLLAEVEGAIEAAIGLEGGETVANPFSESEAAVSLLDVRAAQLRAA